METVVRRDLVEHFSGDVILESFSAEEQAILEAAKAAGKRKPYLTKLTAQISEVDHRNQNKRYYSRALMETNLNRIRPMLEAGRIMGQSDHPEVGEAPKTAAQAVLWEKVWIDEANIMWGTGKVMNTRVGQDLYAILAAGGRPGVSSRGSGSVTRKLEGEEATDYVNEDYLLKTFDMVVDPSVATALVVSIHEGKQEEEMSEGNKDLTLDGIKAALGGLNAEQTVAHMSAEQREGIKAILAKDLIDESADLKTKLENATKTAEAGSEIAEQLKEATEQKVLGEELIQELVTVLENFSVKVHGGLTLGSVLSVLEAHGVEMSEGLTKGLNEAQAAAMWVTRNKGTGSKTGSPKDSKASSGSSSPGSGVLKDKEKDNGSTLEALRADPLFAEILETNRVAKANTLLAEVLRANPSVHTSRVQDDVLATYLSETVAPGTEAERMLAIFQKEEGKVISILESVGIGIKAPTSTINEKDEPIKPVLTESQKRSREIAGLNG